MSKCEQNGRVCIRIPSDGKCMSCDGNNFLSVRDFIESCIGKRSPTNKAVYDKWLNRKDPEDYERMIKSEETKEI